MNQEINIAYTQKDEQALVAAILKRFDIWSVPKVFKEGEGIPKPLGGYLNQNQKVFFGGEIKTLDDYIKPIIEDNILTREKKQTDNFQLETSRYDSQNPREVFYLVWNAPKCDGNTIRSGSIMKAFYLSYYPAPQEVLSLFSFIENLIKQTFPFITTKENPGYVGREMAELVLSKQRFLYYDMIENPDFSA